MKYIFAMLLFILAAVNAAEESIDSSLIVPISASALYPDYNLTEISVSGDGRVNQRQMSVLVPLFDVTTHKRIGQWAYQFKGQEYNDAQAAFTSDKALFQAMLVKVGAPVTTLATVKDNLVNIIPVAPRAITPHK